MYLSHIKFENDSKQNATVEARKSCDRLGAPKLGIRNIPAAIPVKTGVIKV